MRKSVNALCEQQRRRPACAYATCYIRNFKTLASFCGCAGRFESYLVENPEERFSRDEAHIMLIFLKWLFAARTSLTKANSLQILIKNPWTFSDLVA